MENLPGQMCYVCLPGEGYVNEEECGNTMGRDGGVEGREVYTRRSRFVYRFVYIIANIKERVLLVCIYVYIHRGYRSFLSR